jgi:flagellar biosynthetic protein FliR
MITVTSAELNTWIASFLWPLTRIIGLISVAPLFGNVSVPARVKISLGVMIALIVAPAVPAVPATDPMSLAGLLILAQQLVIGLAMGFAIRIVFAGVEMAGEITGMTMGLGFASFYDPQTRARSSAISQFLALVTLMVYLATDMHLVVLATLTQSFEMLPISSGQLAGQGFMQVVSWGGRIFSAGVQLSLPMVAALLITNVALGVLTRAAPQLNMVLPYLATPIVNLFHEGIGMIRQITMAMLPIAAP